MKAAEAILIVGTVIAVAAFGGTEPLSFAFVEILFFAAGIWLLLRPPAVATPVPSGHFLVPALLTAVVLVQLGPLPVSLVSRIAVHAAYGEEHLSALTFASYNSRSALLILLACFVAFFVSRMVNQDRARKARLIYALVALAVVEAFYGLAQYLMNVQTIFWFSKKYDLEEATGTYINRNHFAGMLEMVLPFAVSLAIYEGERLLARRKRRHGGSSDASRAQKIAGDHKAYAMILWLALAVVLMVAIVFSRSRMGILASSFSILAIFSLKLLQRKQKAFPMALGAVFVALSLWLAVWIGVRPALTRFKNIGQEFSGNESRLSLWPATLKLIAAHPFTGTGLGTFPIAFTQVQKTFLRNFVPHAHNDYLEFASDLGVPAALLLFGGIIFVLVRAVRNSFRGEGKYDPAISLACCGSILAILLHSFTDFNLHIPANALLFAVILGLSLAPSSQNFSLPNSPAEAG